MTKSEHAQFLRLSMLTFIRKIISDFTEKLVAEKTASTLIDEAIDKVGEE